MADIKLNREISFRNKEKHYIALLPGSKKAKLSVGIPFFLEVADYMIFMDEGKIVERAKTKEFFENPKSDRTKLFLSQIL